MPRSPLLGVALLGAGAVIVGNTAYNYAGDGIALWDPQGGGAPQYLGPVVTGQLNLTVQQLVQFVIGILLILFGLRLLLR